MRLIDAAAFTQDNARLLKGVEMADIIDRDELIRGVLTAYENAKEKAGVNFQDVVCVVRRKNCRHWEYDSVFNRGWCRSIERDENFFCADGERGQRRTEWTNEKL